jgi:glycosyltransferase involved in cell wall biosynthesis
VALRKLIERDRVKVSFLMLGFRDFSSGGYHFNFKMVEALRLSGHEVDVVHFTTLPEKIRGSRLGGSFHFLRSVLKYKPDLIIISKSYSFMVPLRLLLSFRRYPVLYMVHHLEWHDRASRVSSFRKNIVRWFLACGTRIWVNSRSTADDVISLGIPPLKLSIVPPGFHRFELHPEKRTGKPVTILSVGTVCPRKDQLTLIRACALLEQRDFRLLILGDETSDTGYAQRVRREAENNSLSGKVVFTGHLSREDLHRLYNESSILANLSHWEGYGIAVAEAMWAGLPVVAAGTGAVPELVTHGVEGFLIEPGDEKRCAGHLRELVDNDALREKMSMNAHKRAEKLFTWHETGREFVNLAEETAGCKIRRHKPR